MAIKNARAEDGRVTPHLMVRGGRKAIDFYTRVGRTMIMVTDERPPSPDGMTLGVSAPESLGATTTILEYYVDDVDVTYQRAVDAGAKPVLPICDAFYGDRTGWVMDPCGHIWALSTVKEELTPDEIHERMLAAHKQR
jgi:PhnB protein